jgi:hypothetical protein
MAVGRPARPFWPQQLHRVLRTVRYRCRHMNEPGVLETLSDT